MRRSESYVLCEGFRDRAFLKGWAEHRGWRSPKDEELSRFKDPFGIKVVKGHYGLTKGESFLRLVPSRGDVRLLQKDAETRLMERDRPLDALVLARDLNGQPLEAATRSFEAWRDSVAQDAATASLAASARCEMLAWHVLAADLDAAGPGASFEGQTLEKVLCVAMVRAYPDRGVEVQDFLAAGHGVADKRHKAHAMSFMAKWFPDAGSDGFYQLVWTDAPVAEQLEHLLRATGAWDIFEQLG